MSQENGLITNLERIEFSIKNHKYFSCIVLIMVVALFLGNVGGSEARQLFKKDSTKSEIKSKKLYFIPLPAISYNPAFGFIYGVAATSSILLGDPKDTKLSSGFLNATYSSKKQLVIGLKTTIYTQKNK